MTISDQVDVEHRGDARQVVLAVSDGRGQHVAISTGQLDNERREISRQMVDISGSVSDQHLGHVSVLVTGDFDPVGEGTPGRSRSARLASARFGCCRCRWPLVEDHQLRLLLVYYGIGDGQRTQLVVGLDKHGAVGAAGQGGAQPLLGRGRPSDTTTIFVAMPFSSRCTASSSAISRNGFMAILTLAVLTQPSRCR